MKSVYLAVSVVAVGVIQKLEALRDACGSDTVVLPAQIDTRVSALVLSADPAQNALNSF